MQNKNKYSNTEFENACHANPAVPAQEVFARTMEEAEAVAVTEVGKHFRSNLEEVIRQFDSDTGQPIRTFVVRVTEKVVPPPPPATNPDEESKEYLLQSAEILIGHKEFVLARNIFSSLLKSNGKDGHALKGLGTCLYYLGEYVSARKCFFNLIEMKKEERFYLWVGLCYSAEGKDGLAIDEFKKIQHPSSLTSAEQFDLYKELGNCYTRLSDFMLAEKYYEKALDLNPASDIIYVNRGTLEVQKGQLDKAIVHFKKSLELNPQNHRAYCGLGIISTLRSENQKAWSEFESALKIESQNKVALLQMLALAESGEAITKVRGHIQKYLEKDARNVEMLFALSITLYKQGEWTECQHRIDEILKIDAHHLKAKELKEQLNLNKHYHT